MPIFMFFAGYNFKAKISFRNLYCGLFICCTTHLFALKLQGLNILISIFFGHLYLYFMRNEIEKSLFLQSFLLIMLYPITLYIFEYGSLAILLIVLGYSSKIGKLDLKKAAAFIAILTFINTIITFTSFGLKEHLLSLITQICVFFSLILYSFEKEIQQLFYKKISKNALFIFCFHILCMSFIEKFTLKI